MKLEKKGIKCTIYLDEFFCNKDPNCGWCNELKCTPTLGKPISSICPTRSNCNPTSQNCYTGRYDKNGWKFDSNPDCTNLKCSGYYLCGSDCQNAISSQWTVDNSGKKINNKNNNNKVSNNNSNNNINKNKNNNNINNRPSSNNGNNENAINNSINNSAISFSSNNDANNNLNGVNVNVSTATSINSNSNTGSNVNIKSNNSSNNTKSNQSNLNLNSSGSSKNNERIKINKNNNTINTNNNNNTNISSKNGLNQNTDNSFYSSNNLLNSNELPLPTLNNPSISNNPLTVDNNNINDINSNQYLNISSSSNSKEAIKYNSNKFNYRNLIPIAVPILFIAFFGILFVKKNKIAKSIRKIFKPSKEDFSSNFNMRKFTDVGNSFTYYRYSRQY
ncbi:hypothetical protein BCR36DRAFT_586448 [Piromyces finnis]|uniref:Uncharacterized protein n=1 Tax=Piromyces finnis TaxID=1754191 RepID=A0A1Y1UYT8_9FUNG|nr:hypothetical protein BCR36DRAFT_586448 [Piromyces finnis]|eukprot:ORX43733.1 hypothetical protein BCR36DRAFT_586448 [Piromyces finnis]